MESTSLACPKLFIQWRNGAARLPRVSALLSSAIGFAQLWLAVVRTAKNFQGHQEATRKFNFMVYYAFHGVHIERFTCNCVSLVCIVYLVINLVYRFTRLCCTLFLSGATLPRSPNRLPKVQLPFQMALMADLTNQLDSGRRKCMSALLLRYQVFMNADSAGKWFEVAALNYWFCLPLM